MFGVPLLVYPLLIAGISSLAASKMQEQKVRQAKVAVVNGADAPELLRRLKLPENHIDLNPAEASKESLQNGKLDLILTVPEHAERELLSTEAAASTHPASGNGPATTAPATQPSFTLEVNKSRGESDSTEERVQSILAGYQKWLTDQRLSALRVPKDVVAPLEKKVVDIATQDQRLGRLLAQLLPVLLLVTGMLGAFFPALNATTTERELGTLETLLVTPVNRTELLFSKGLLVLCCSILTSGLNMTSMSLVFLRVASMAGEKLGTLSLDPVLLFLAFLATIPSLVFFSAAVMCVGMIARTYREANSFAAPVMMLPMAAMAVGMADPETTKALLATPVANTTLLIRDILTHRASFSNFAIAAGSNLLFAFALISIAARLFTNEQLVNPAWEPISLKGFKRGGGVRKRRWPTVDEALILTALTVLTQFYVGPSIGKLYEHGTIGAPMLVLLLQLVSFPLPVAIFALLGRYPVQRVFAFFKPKLPAIPAAVVLGFSLAFVAVAWSTLQSHFFKSAPSDSQKFTEELIGSSIDASPWLAVLTFGMIPGFCEELLFRGPVLSALRKTFARNSFIPALTSEPLGPGGMGGGMAGGAGLNGRTLSQGEHTAIWITAFLFALVHMDLAGMPLRTVLGAILGYTVAYTGSLFPAMLLHAAFNGTQVGIEAYFNAAYAGSATTRATPNFVPPSMQLTNSLFWLRTLAAIVVAFGAAYTLRLSRKPLPPTIAN